METSPADAQTDPAKRGDLEVLDRHLADWIKPAVLPILENSVIIVLVTWGTIIFEILLFSAIVMENKRRKKLLIPGIIFHLSIVFVFCLVSFFFAMLAALILLLRPLDEPFRFEWLKKLFDKTLIRQKYFSISLYLMPWKQ